MDEARLIEIAQRFRKLEDACDAAGIVMGGNPHPDDALEDDESMASVLERQLESCRKDIVEMQECIRRKV